ncbi:predicted protein [Naegleria gruberi]|uniref:Predicted protein n=1 Tax=Naegleria gruberi TaxID=5762 RepID=D2VFW8_NAEGR|nr:uncharacterized protein NAEGRDRAFT_79823 [Naegleria gruberi]EFC44261.1 predicted protein [Naegleria gruberi]|eukprot:XP_002677005.1 predicted protein [Naegleria gruberi strain NEG-M]
MSSTEAKKATRFVDSDLREGDLIFVKLDGCPYWPAKVISPHSTKIPKSMREEILEGMEDEDGTSSLIEFFGDDKSKYYWMDRVVEIYTRNPAVITNEMTRKNKKLAEAMRQANSYSEKSSTDDKQTIQQRRSSFSDKNLTISTPPSKKRKAVEIDSKKKSKVVIDSDSEDDNEEEELSDEDDNVSDYSSDGEKRNNDNLEEEEYSFSEEEEEEKPKPVKRKIKRTKVEEVDKNTCHKCGKYYKVTVQCTNDECGKVLCKKCCGNPRLDKKYFEDWLCSDCKVCTMCEKKTCPITQGNETSRGLYTCTKCDISYHVNCLAGEGTYVLYNGSLICPECTEKKLEWLERRGEKDPEVYDFLFETEKKDYSMKNVKVSDMEDDEEEEQEEEDEEEEDKKATNENSEKSEKVVAVYSTAPELVKKVEDEEEPLSLNVSNEMEKALQCFEKKEEDSPKKKSPKCGKASKHKSSPLGQFTENIENPPLTPPPQQQQQPVCVKKECHTCSSTEKKFSSPSSESPVDSKRLPTSGKSRKATKVRHRVSESSESSGNLGIASSPKEADSFNTSPTASPPTTPLSGQLSENEITLFIKCALDGSTDYTKRVRVSNQIDVSQLKNITKSIVLKMKKSTMLDAHKLFLKNVDRFGHEVLLNLDDDFFQNDKLQNNDVLVMQF